MAILFKVAVTLLILGLVTAITGEVVSESTARRNVERVARKVIRWGFKLIVVGGVLLLTCLLGAVWQL